MLCTQSLVLCSSPSRRRREVSLGTRFRKPGSSPEKRDMKPTLDTGMVCRSLTGVVYRSLMMEWWSAGPSLNRAGQQGHSLHRVDLQVLLYAGLVNK